MVRPAIQYPARSSTMAKERGNAVIRSGHPGKVCLALTAVGLIIAVLVGTSPSTACARTILTITPSSGIGGSISPSTAQTVTSSAIGITCLGDSITAFGERTGWVRQLGDRIAPGVVPLMSNEGSRTTILRYPGALTVYGLGVGGNTTTQMRARFAADVLVTRSDYVIILGGVNDIIARADAATIFGNLQWLAESARSNGITPVLGTLLPCNWLDAAQWHTLDDVNTRVRAYASESGVTCVDFFDAMESPIGSGQSPYLMDGIHPNEEGHTRMAAAFDVSWFDDAVHVVPPPLLFLITADPGCRIADVRVDGASVGAVSTYAFTNVTTDHTISAIFKRLTKLSIVSSRTTVRHGHAVTYSGTLSPNIGNGTHVIVEIRKSGSTKWTTLATRHTYSSHRWSYSYTPRTRKPGTFYVRVRYAGSAKYLSSFSVSKRLVTR
jgi:lysophospholipase L1-like esterase